MSEKNNIKTTDKKKLTRSAVSENPTLRQQLHGSLEENIFRRSAKIKRSPIKTKIHKTPPENKRTTPKLSSTKNQELPSTSNTTNKGLLSTTSSEFDLEISQRYSDIGGYFAEQSLIGGTPKTTKSEESVIESYSIETSSPEANKPDTKHTNQLTNLRINPLGQSTAKTMQQDTSKMATNGRLSPTQLSRPMKLSLKDVANYVPEYDGENMSPADYIKKLQQVRNLIDDIDEPNLTNLLKVRMKGEVGDALGSSDINNIPDLITGIRTLYPIEDDIHELYAKVRKLIQGENETVIHYTNRLRKLVLKIKELMKAERTTSEEQRNFNRTLDNDAAISFKKGLKPEIKYELGQENTVIELSTKAIEIENDIKRRKTISNTYLKYEERSEEPKKVLTCQICRDFQHEALFCRKAACVYCKRTDHFSNSCNNVKTKINLICKFCSQPSHSISACRLNKRQNLHCQYCQELGHEVDQCPYISNYESCWKCNGIGHDPNRCSNNTASNENKCEYCDTTGHKIQNCPDVICKKCNNRGHTIKNCKVDERRSLFNVCTICQNLGHTESNCEEYKILVTEYKAKQQYKCQLCEEVGHTAKYCPTISKSQQATHNINKFQRKFCDYCKYTGHVTDECRKLAQLVNYKQVNPNKICQFCKNPGHLIDTCSKIKLLQAEINEFCETCKSIGHKAETCFRNKNKPENFEALSGRNA